MNLSELSPLRSPFSSSFEENAPWDEEFSFNFLNVEEKENEEEASNFSSLNFVQMDSPRFPLPERQTMIDVAMNLMESRVKEIFMSIFPKTKSRDACFFHRKTTRAIRYALCPIFPFLNEAIELFKEKLLPLVVSLKKVEKKKRLLIACMDSISTSTVCLKEAHYHTLLDFFESLVPSPQLLYKNVIFSAFDQICFKSFEVHLKRAHSLGVQNHSFPSQTLFLTKIANLLLDFLSSQATLLQPEKKRDHLQKALQAFYDAMDLLESKFAVTESGIRILTFLFKHADLEKEVILSAIGKLKMTGDRKISLIHMAFQASFFVDPAFFYFFSKCLTEFETRKFFSISASRFLKRLIEVGHDKDSQIYKDVKKWVMDKSKEPFRWDRFENEFEEPFCYPEPSLYLVNYF